MTLTWDESDARASTIFGDGDSLIDNVEVGSPSQPRSAYESWVQEQAFPKSHYMTADKRAGILDATSKVPAVEYELDGRTYNLWVVGPNGEDLLRASEDEIESVRVFAPANSTHSFHADRSIRHFKQAVSDAQRENRQITWPGQPTFKETSRGYSVALKAFQGQGRVGPMQWTLTPSQGKDQAWGSWSRGHSVLFKHRLRDSGEFLGVLPAGVIMLDVNLHDIEPTRYTRDGQTFNLWIVTEEGHNLLGSLNDLEVISLKITDPSRKRAADILKTYSDNAYGHNFYGRREQGQCWTGGKYFREIRENGTIEHTLSEYEPGEDLLSWTLTAPQKDWGGWYSEHQVELSYRPTLTSPRTIQASVILEPIAD